MLFSGGEISIFLCFAFSYVWICDTWIFWGVLVVNFCCPDLNNSLLKYFAHLLATSPSRLYVETGHTKGRHYLGFYSVFCYIKSLFCFPLMAHNNFPHSDFVCCASGLSNTGTPEAMQYSFGHVLKLCFISIKNNHR